MPDDAKISPGGPKGSGENRGGSLKLALLPVDVRIGDFEGNLKIHRARVKEAAERGANLLVFPELSLVGYFPRDLLHRPSWGEKALGQLDQFHAWLKESYPQLAVIVGSALPVEGADSVNPKGLANCAVFLQGDRREIRAKTLIPYYEIFQESRYFDSAATLPDSYRAPIELQGKKIGLLICEDSWHGMSFRGCEIYTENPSKRLAEAGCDLLINISASPFDRRKKERRRDTVESSARELGITIAYVNQFGAQDDLLFDGDCFVYGPGGGLLAEKSEAGVEPLYWSGSASPSGTKPADRELRSLRTMLVTGIRDYARKNGFTRLVLGLSGGIDSALVACLAVEAVGAENVIGISMPSKFSSPHSLSDAEALAQNLGLIHRHLPIKMVHSTFLMALKPAFAGLPEDVTEENLQSRIRGTTVMAFANKFRALALATGNKSEFAMGYTTLYGDMNGALAPIGDLYKEEVYELSRFLNREKARIPESSLTKAPSAELRPGQTDQDTLPPYDLLDSCLRLLVEEELEPDAALARLRTQFPEASAELVAKTHRAVALNEYKRRQAPPILRVSPRAFGPGRPYPITCLY